MKDNLKEVDGKIERFDTLNEEGHFRFPVYLLTAENEQKYFAIQYAKEPLETLREMRNSGQAKGVNKQNCKEEVERLYNTLLGILDDPPNQDFKEMCVLVPIAKSSKSLQNGGLTRCIMDIMQPCDTQNDSGASTSENSSEMAHTANESQQNDQVDGVPSHTQSGQSAYDAQEQNEERRTFSKDSIRQTSIITTEFDEYKKITEVLIQRDRFQHSTTFEYSNVIDKVNPSETKRYQDEVSRLKKDLSSEREKCKRLEADLCILIKGRSCEVNELNDIIASLEFKLKATEATNSP
ncbi:Hypothetical predicted protein [Paramuricea clavata]|uniref:Uncharacterized protein n=1 Tax=Paramuricea clavata TaxID=317549 RepID=A0A6S7K9S0_PARCT|nr:Hypothetical predicted protein [Paramuricea clavata]